MSKTDQRDVAARRGFLANVCLFTGLAAGYGLGALHFLRYLVPLRRQGQRREMFVGTLSGIPLGATVTVRDPAGQEIILTRNAGGSHNPASEFRALSTKCPHLGCKVHWEAAKERFRCPCHEGVFDKDGRAVSGPPAKEGKDLTTYEVRVDPENGWVFVMVAQEPGYGA